MTAVDLDSLEVKKMRTLPYGETFQSVRCVNWFARFYSNGPNLFLSFFSHKAPVRRVVFPRHLFLSLKAKLTTICDNKIKSENKKKEDIYQCRMSSRALVNFEAIPSFASLRYNIQHS